MGYRVVIGERMSGGDRVVIVNGKHAEHYLSDGFGGTVHIWGPHIEPAPGKSQWPYDSVADAVRALRRSLRRGGGLAVALQRAGTGQA